MLLGASLYAAVHLVSSTIGGAMCQRRLPLCSFNIQRVSLISMFATVLRREQFRKGCMRELC
jgi:hypothetical protein